MVLSIVTEMVHSQRIDSSIAFFNNPILRFSKVARRLAAFSIGLITIFFRPILDVEWKERLRLIYCG